MAYDAKSLRLREIRWIGAFPSDSEKCLLPQQCLLPLTTEGIYDRKALSPSFKEPDVLTKVMNDLLDKQKARGILQRCYMERKVPYWRLNSGLWLFVLLPYIYLILY